MSLEITRSDLHHAGAEIDIRNLSGDWLNVNRQYNFIQALTVSNTHDQLGLRLFTGIIPGNTGIIESDATVYTIPQSDQAAGFITECDTDDTKSTIVANEKLGILVLQCYIKLKQNTGTNILTREFYRRGGFTEDFSYKDSPSDYDVQSGTADSTWKGTHEFLSGQWMNTYDHTNWIDSFIIVENGGNWTIKFHFLPDPGQWEETDLELFYLDDNELGFIFHVRKGNIESFFSAYSNKGLLVVSGYHTINKIGGTKKVMSREFYFNQQGIPSRFLR